jgi:predicted lipoprotein with Yx(FWY)xxD motif
MRCSLLLMAVALMLIAGCGEDAEPPPAPPVAEATATPMPTPTATATKPKARKPRGTRLKIGDSQFGPMLFDSRNQAIYVFERDRENRTVCYGECAEAWPPVLTEGEPVAGKGVDKRLLGSVKRRDGELQVTYAGRPLYFYAHEGPGQVLCHNVDLNGGLWWVVGPDGAPRP